MGGVNFSIVIDAPPERVFERLADVATHPSWANPKADMRMEQTRVQARDPSPRTARRVSSSASP